MLKNKALLFMLVVVILGVAAVPIYRLIVSSSDDVAKLGNEAKTALSSTFSSNEEETTEAKSEAGSPADPALASAGATASEAVAREKARLAKVKAEKEKAEAKVKLLSRINRIQIGVFATFVAFLIWFVVFHRYLHVQIPVPKHPRNPEKAKKGSRRFKMPRIRVSFRKQKEPLFDELLPPPDDEPGGGQRPFFDEFPPLPGDELEDEEPPEAEPEMREHMSVFDLSTGDLAFLVTVFAILAVGWIASHHFMTRDPYEWLPDGTHWIGVFVYVFALMINVLLVFASYFVVPARQRWIQEFFGKEQCIMFSGLHFRIPLKHNKEVPVVLKKEATEDEEGKKKPTGAIESKVETVRVFWWDTPGYAKADLRENTDDLKADNVLCQDGWKPKIDLLLAFSVEEVDPTMPIRGAGMKDQPPYNYCYNYKRLGKVDELIQGMESETDTAVRQWASLVPYVPPFDEEDLAAYTERIGNETTSHLVALNQSQYFISLAVFYRLMGEFQPEKEPENEDERRKADKVQEDFDRIVKQVPVAVIEHICPKGGLILRSVQTQKLIPPKEFDTQIAAMRKDELEAKGRIMKARGEKEYLETVAAGQASAIDQRGKAYTGAITSIAGAGVSPDRAAQSFETLEGQRTWEGVANSPNKMIIAGGQKGIADVATGAEILAEALSGLGATKPGTSKSEPASDDTSDKKPEEGESE